MVADNQSVTGETIRNYVEANFPARLVNSSWIAKGSSMFTGWQARIALVFATSICLTGGQLRPCRSQVIDIESSPRLLEDYYSSSSRSDESNLLNDAAANPEATGEANAHAFLNNDFEFRSHENSRAGRSHPKQRIGLRDLFPLFTGDASLDGASPVVDTTQSFGSVWFFDYDAFMGVPDGGWENNGLRTGFNFASRLGLITERTGICSQIGASFGVYDWAGTDYRLQHTDRAETQGFLTYGFYRKSTDSSRLVGALVQDWSFNDTYGVFAQNPVMSQLRGQLGYAASASNEYGVAGAVHVMSSTRSVPFFGETTWQPISQLSWYWHHKWHAGGPDTWLSIGLPSRSRLTGEGSVGDYLVSAIANCPFSDAVSLVSGVTYMHPSSSPGPAGATDEMWNFSVGISIYPARNARTATIAGQQAMPLLPVANNGSFIVDTNKTY